MKTEPIPDYGDIYPLNTFIEHCKFNWFIDDDGIGRLSSETEMSDIQVSPSELVLKDFDPRGWTHVIWFNK